jgi:hypothetical protein
MTRFPETHCSQCGGTFGPGDSGFSHCEDHPPYAKAYNPKIYANADQIECPSCRAHRNHCRLCGGSGVVTEEQARDWPPT